MQLAELDTLLGAADDRGKAVLLLGISAGLRREEIAALQWEDVNLESGILRIRNSEWHITKSGRPNRIPMDATENSENPCRQ